jgi:hypothetical protein
MLGNDVPVFLGALEHFAELGLIACFVSVGHDVSS